MVADSWTSQAAEPSGKFATIKDEYTGITLLYSYY